MGAVERGEMVSRKYVKKDSIFNRKKTNRANKLILINLDRFLKS